MFKLSSADRKFFGFTMLVALIVTGCAAVLDHFPGATPVACVAEYFQLANGDSLGIDGCGNYWLKSDGRCYILEDSLTALEEIKCPAPGDTLAVVE